MDGVPNFAIDELLAHAGWARKLARALIADPDEADDLVQETWLAALHHPPRSSGPPRPWLARVMTNLARNRWRGAARRNQREIQTARPDSQPGGDEVAQELEMHAALVEALSGLDESLSRTVVRRYFHDLSSAEIARSEGVPESTVRNRLKRALDLLRAKLDRKYGDRSVWGAMLLPIATRHGIPGTAAPTASAAAVTGVITMTAFWKVAAAVAVSLAMGAWAWNRSHTRTESVAAVVASPESGGLSGVPEHEIAIPPGTDSRSAIAANVPPSPAGANSAQAVLPGVIEARAVDPDGLPIAGAQLTVVDRVAVGDIDEAEAPRATSDESGRLRLEVHRSDRFRRRGWAGNAPKEKWTLDIAIGAPGRETRGESATVTDGHTGSLGDVTLRPAGSIVGRVLAPGGKDRRKPSIEVIPPDLTLVEQEQARSHGIYKSRGSWALVREDGSYQVIGVPVGTYRVITDVRKPELLQDCSRPFDVKAGEKVEVPDLVLLPNPNVIEGTVLGPDGEPVAGKDVAYNYSRLVDGAPNLLSGSTTDDAGHFFFALDSAEPCEVYVLYGTRLGEAVEHNVPVGTRDLVLRLRAAEWIDITAVDEHGQPLPAFLLDGRLEKENSVFYTSGGPRPGGRARIPVKAVPFYVQVSAQGRCDRTLGPFDPEHHPSELTVALPPLVPVQGRVLSAGQPVIGAEVFLERPVAQGRLHACNGFPCRFDGGHGPNSTKTDAEGRFSITVREAGAYALVATSAECAEAETQLVRIDPDAERPEFQIELSRGGRLEGNVIAAAGRSPAGALLGISRGDGKCRVMRTAADGRFEFEHLAAGVWSMRRCERDFVAGGEVTHRDVGGFDPTLVEFSIEDGKTTHLDFDLRSAESSVEGKIPPGLLRSGKWAVRLRTNDRESEDVQGEIVGTDGAFRVVATMLGPQTLVLADAGENDRDQEITSPVHLDRGVNAWSLSLATGSLEGEATPRALLQHSWTNASGTTCTTHFLADAEGRFHIEGIPAGPGKIEILRPKGSAAFVSVEVPENGVVQVPLR